MLLGRRRRLNGREERGIGLLSELRVHVVREVLECEGEGLHTGAQEVRQVRVPVKALQGRHAGLVGVRLRGWGTAGKQRLLEAGDLAFHQRELLEKSLQKLRGVRHRGRKRTTKESGHKENQKVL